MNGMEPPTPNDVYGFLLGCEVVKALLRADARCCRGVTDNPRAIMVRYVFLIPPNAVEDNNAFKGLVVIYLDMVEGEM